MQQLVNCMRYQEQACHSAAQQEHPRATAAAAPSVLLGLPCMNTSLHAATFSWQARSHGVMHGKQGVMESCMLASMTAQLAVPSVHFASNILHERMFVDQTTTKQTGCRRKPKSTEGTA
jgi:hypothetical protein